MNPEKTPYKILELLKEKIIENQQSIPQEFGSQSDAIKDLHCAPARVGQESHYILATQRNFSRANLSLLTLREGQTLEDQNTDFVRNVTDTEAVFIIKQSALERVLGIRSTGISTFAESKNIKNIIQQQESNQQKIISEDPRGYAMKETLCKVFNGVKYKETDVWIHDVNFEPLAAEMGGQNVYVVHTSPSFSRPFWNEKLGLKTKLAGDRGENIEYDCVRTSSFPLFEFTIKAKPLEDALKAKGHNFSFSDRGRG